MGDGRPLVLSVAAHGVVFAAAAAWVTDGGVAPAVRVRAPEVRPTEVSVVVVAPPAAAVAAASTAPGRAPAPAPVGERAGPRSRRRGGSRSVAVAPPAPAVARGLGMRRPGAGRVDLAVPRGLEVPPGAPPPPERPPGKLEPAGEGAVIHDLVATIDVAPDGSVKVRDKPDAEAKLVRVTMKDLGDLLDAWWKDPMAGTRVGTWHEQPRTAHAQDPAERHPSDAPQKRNATPARVLGEFGNLFLPRLVGSFDITAWAMRKAHAGDPYAARKLAAIDGTRDERVARGAAHRREEQARAGQIMRANLQALWRRPLSPAERRTALFVMWDECAEGDGPLGEAGELARRAALGWIRGHLAKGTPDGYSDEELAALNARRVSKQRFAPYDD